MVKTALKIPATCAAGDESRRRCDQCLRERLMTRPGIRGIRLRCDPGSDRATIELDYDPTLVTLSQLQTEVSRAGVCLSENRATLVLGIDGMVSPRSERPIEAALARLPGVVAIASFASRSLRIEFDRSACAIPEIARRLDEMGYRIRPGGPVRAVTPAGGVRAAMRRMLGLLTGHQEMTLAIVGALLLLGAVIANAMHVPAVVRYVLVAGAMLTAGWSTAADTIKILLRFQFDIDVLMFAAAIGASLLGNYEEGAFLLVLFAFGGAGEELAIERARDAIEALTKLAPDTATVRDPDGRQRLVRVEDLKVGDDVIVRPFDRVPADGAVKSGASAIDQSPITGESIPVEKVAGSPVFAGTINGEGMLDVTVSRPASESTLAKIVRMVNEAQTTKSPTQLFTDKVERWYVPFVLIATAALIVVPPLLHLPHRQTDKGEWAGWFYQAMAFLTGASPCALAIGTPAAVLSGIARAARIGVLVKGGVHLENLGRVRVVAFDKTGTLTRGRPEVTDVVSVTSIAADELLSLAAAVERTSTHPLAQAIVAEATAREIAIPDVEDVQQVAGQGISATAGVRRVAAGRASMFADRDGNPGSPLAQAMARLDAEGKSAVVIAVDGEPVGVIGLADRPRPGAAAAIAMLKRMGITRTIMLTGDRAPVAAAIAGQLGIDSYHAELLPNDKLELVRRLQREHGAIAMVGDGVNDAPALATATVGIAMGGAGSDVAIETADVALMADDLSKLPAAVGLSRYSRRIIKQNLVIALGVISVLAPLAALGFTYLGVAVLFHEGSTVVVVLNSLRILWYRPK